MSMLLSGRCSSTTTINMVVTLLLALLSTELLISTVGASFVSISKPIVPRKNEGSSTPVGSFSLSSSYPNHYLSERRTNHGNTLLLYMATGKDGNIGSKEKIDIDAVTAEVGDALREAEEAIANSQNGKKKSAAVVPPPPPANDRYTVSSAPRVPPATTTTTTTTSTSPSKPIDPVIRTDAIAAAIGALPVGAVLGSLLVDQIPELALDPLLPPLATSLLLSASSLVLGLQDDNLIGSIVRTIFGKPVLAIGGAFVGAIQNAVSNIIQNIQAIPGKITSAVTKQAEQTVQGIQAIPGKIQDAAVSTAQKTADSITQVAENTKAGIEQKIQQTATDIKNLPKKITLVAQDVADEVVTEIKKTPNKISTAAQQAVENVVESATTAAEQTVDNTKKKFEAVVEDAKQLPSKAVDEIKNLPNKAVTELKKATAEQPKPPKLPPPPPLLENQPGVTTVSDIRPPQELPKIDAVVDFIPIPPKVGLPQIKSFPTPPADEIPVQQAEPTKEEKIAKTIAEQAKVVIKSSPSISIPKLPNLEALAKSISDTVVASSPTIPIPKPAVDQKKKKFDTADANERASISVAVAQVAAEERRKKEQLQKDKVTKDAAAKAAKDREAAAKAAKEQEQARMKQQQLEAQQKEAAAQRAAAANKAAAAAAAKKQAEQLSRLKIDTTAADKKKEAEEKQRAAAAQKKKEADEKQRAAAAAALQKKKEAEEKQRAAVAATAAQKKKEAEEKQRLIQLQKQEQQAAAAQRKQEEIAARREAIQRQKEQELEKQRQLAAERKKKEDEQKLAKAAAAAAAAKQKQAAATVAQAARGASIRIAPASTAPTTKVAPKGVATIVRWNKRADGGISGRIYGSQNFKDGERVETSPIVNGVVANGNVVKTGSGSRYFLSDTTPSSAKTDAPLKSLLNALPGATIQLTKDAKDKEAKRALAAVTEAKPRSTFSLFGLGGGSSSVSKGTPSIKVSSSPSIPIPKKATTIAASKKVSAAPRGVPTITRWRKNRDGSISGLIFGSNAFKDGERITTSAIAQGTIQSGQTVKTGSGSRYYLE